ncbi:MAG: hypothetical protein EHM23_26280 [Acidobacteria bacterium]|nr:MAG: hypothetical protein EHM23_26280 [Acidobacteriota bacterium]
MMLQEQLLYPQHPPVLPYMPSAGAFLGNALLGNVAIQVPTRITDSYALVAAYRELLAQAQPTAKLALLKRQKFTAEGRSQRVASSLAAVNGPQPTRLTAAQWKEIVEEVEEED